MTNKEARQILSDMQFSTFSPRPNNMYHKIREALGIAMNAIDELSNRPAWNDASKRPLKAGQYIVLGLREFTPDHSDQPNARWELRTAIWSDRFGWNTKVKYWMESPELPDERR